MKKHIQMILVCLSSILMMMVCCNDAWAGTSQNGGTSAGSGSCDCNGSTPSCSTNCGEVGGGRSWRLYDIRNTNCRKGKNSECVDIINSKNSGARRLVAFDSIYGTGVTINAKKVRTCVNKNAAYIAVLGLNGINKNSSGNNKFYILYNQVNPSSGVNRGYYYDWNNTGAIRSTDDFRTKWNNGRIAGGTIITNAVAEELVKEDPDLKNVRFNQVGMFCVWPDGPPPVQYDLIAYAVDGSNGKLLQNDPIDSDEEVEEGDEGFVWAIDDFPNYTFACWSLARNCNNPITSEDPDDPPRWYTKLNMRENLTVYAVYNKTKYTLSGVAVDIKGSNLGTSCNPNSVTVLQGSSATIYSKSCAGYKVRGWATARTGTPSGNTAFYTVPSLQSDTTVYVIYEKDFASDCPSEYGIPVPSSYTNSSIWGGVTSTDTRIKNDSVGNTWEVSAVYAKPNDTVSWVHCYFPGVQTVADFVVNGSAIRNQVSPFENEYTVSRGSYSRIKNWSGTVGDANGTHYKDTSYLITYKMVGSGQTETITTGRPTIITVGTSGTSYTVEQPNEASSSATAYVPYNYINSSEVEVEDDTIYYAGEGGIVMNSIRTDPKENALTSPNKPYATIVKGADREVRMCYTENGNYNCEIVKKGNLNAGGGDGILNPGSKFEGALLEERVSIVVPDVPAGTELCFDSHVFPANSGANTNINPLGSNTWSEWSTPVCVLVAKRPSLQTWGGNVYSAGAIKTGLSVKKRLYKANGSGPYVFGSWGELGVISAGSVSGFASGASIGYLNDGGVAWPEYAGNLNEDLNGRSYPGGGNGSSDFCRRYAVLTFPNSNCNSGGTNVANGNDTSNIINENKGMVESLVKSGEGGKKKTITESQIAIDGFNDDGTNWIAKTGHLTVTGAVLASDTFKLISASSITITGDIAVGDSVILENFDQAPKMVLYSESDIKIGCNVTRLDAVLIAGNSVTTCDSDEDINSAIYSRQLIVNGAIIASKLNANRTYGAARGINSIVSAEIINFDPTLYLWGGAAMGKKGSGDNKNSLSGDLTVTYLNELAPRY